jgi:hypothetical protein
LVAKFVKECALRDFLDLPSLVYTRAPTGSTRVYWIKECRRIFSEERLRYVINDAGGVRFSVDSQFEMDVETTIQGLGHSTLKGALTAYEHCIEAMSATPPDGKTAIRSMFEAVEIVFKTICPGPPRIGKSEVLQHLTPKLTSIYAADATASQVATKIANSLVDWVDAAHFYRHGQAGPEPIQPPLDLAVTIISEGTSFLRWLAGLYAATLPKT